MKQVATIALLILLIISGGAWVGNTKHIFRTTPLKFKIPRGWPQPVYDFKNNPLTEEGFELGRKLFYDGRLSRDGNFPCASCHQQFAAFATYDHSFSHGYNNTLTNRNAPGLFNLAWQKEFMQDGGINHLDVQPLTPITAPNEMGERIDSVLCRLRKDSAYPRMFAAAFGSDTITTRRMCKAISQFLVMLVSDNSLYDRVMRGEASFNLPEKLGYAIFRQKCESCHREPLFTDFSYRNVGLAADPFLNDSGRMRITGQRADSLKFRVPSLRNVMVTAPYGHDGRFFDLMHVFNHYRSGVVNSPTTDSLVRNNLYLSNYEIGQLTAFLATLTDSTFLKNPRFGPSNDLERSLQFKSHLMH